MDKLKDLLRQIVKKEINTEALEVREIYASKGRFEMAQAVINYLDGIPRTLLEIANG
ncbi:hypothetical protein KA005_59085 [bacterium]|nr:hypothetical protein [bacterium]